MNTRRSVFIVSLFVAWFTASLTGCPPSEAAGQEPLTLQAEW